MAASDRTVKEIARVIACHVSSETAQAIVDDLLLTVEGNQSFRDTIAKLAVELRAQNSAIDQAYERLWDGLRGTNEDRQA